MTDECEKGVCGTGTGNFPQPGDPDLNNSIVNATPAFGGIAVFWTYPTINAHAVAHTELYRATTTDTNMMRRIKTVTGDFFFDPVNPSLNVNYYYWIRIISVNGTEGDLLGPASATAKPIKQQTLDMLAGEIRESNLALSLQDELKRIDALNTGLSSETANRLLQYEDLLSDLQKYQQNLEGVSTFIGEEVSRLEENDTAQISQINVLGAKTVSNEALIEEEQETRSTADTALAKDIQAIRASSANTYIQEEAPSPQTVLLEEGDIWVDTSQADDGTDSDLIQYQWDGIEWVETTPGSLAGVHAALEAEKQARINKDGALTKATETLESSVGRKSRTYFEPTVPREPENKGDLWVNTSDKNRLHRWDGSKWADITDKDKSRVFRQEVAPTDIEILEGDLWFDSGADDRAYKWEDGAWAPLNLYTGNQVSAAIQDFKQTQVGYCMINGRPDASKTSKGACEASEGVWLDMHSIADAVKGVQIVDGDNESANVEQRMLAYKDQLGHLNSEYTVKVQARADGQKIAGGWGLATDSEDKQVEAGFDVDRFWVGRVNDSNQAHPFIIDQNQLYLNGKVSFSNVQDADGGISGNTLKKWVRPNTTQINGNQIYAGDAYVDTLQIKGQAITVPSGVSASYKIRTSAHYNWPRSILSIRVYCSGAPILVIASAALMAKSSVNSTSYGRRNYYMRLRRDGRWFPNNYAGMFIKFHSYVITLGFGTANITIRDNPGKGWHTYTMYVGQTYSHGSYPLEVRQRSLTCLEVKR